MAITTFIKFDGVDGESQDRDHRGEIEVLSWSWGFSNAAPAGAGGGAGSGRAVPADLTFVHRYDKASPVLAKAGIAGRHFRTATLSARRSGAGQKDFLKVTLTEVLVTSVQHQGQDDQIAEIVTLRSREVGNEYKPQSANGAMGVPVKFNWNIATSQVT
jgi:type VI secretion system secreted protein Hcp